jgi:UDP-glucose 4-epimerase
MSKRILITGGFGYVGGRIAIELANNPEWIVRLASRKIQSAPSWLPEAETVAIDVLEPGSLSAAMADVQAVVHLAAMNENECIVDPGRAVLINTLGTLNVLQAAIAADVKRFIYFSTAHVYGAPLVGNITEQTLPRPIHPYAITHHGAEDFVLSAHEQKKITGMVVRLSNGFGAPTHPDVDRWTLLVNDLCRQAVHNRKLVLRSSGLQQRNFITLADAGRAVSHLLGLSQADCGDGLFNLGGDNSLLVWDMVQKISLRCELTLGYLPSIERPEPLPDEQVNFLNYCSDKLQKTGFMLRSNLDEEIDRTLLICAQAWGHSKE